MVSNLRRQYWKASPQFSVGTVNIDTLERCFLQVLKMEYEDALEFVLINLPWRVI